MGVSFQIVQVTTLYHTLLVTLTWAGLGAARQSQLPGGQSMCWSEGPPPGVLTHPTLDVVSLMRSEYIPCAHCCVAYFVRACYGMWLVARIECGQECG